MRRALAALAAVPLLLLAAACGSETAAPAADGSAGLKVSGQVGAKPTVAFPAGEPATKSSYKVLETGTGPAVKAGDQLIVNLTVWNWDGKDNALQGSTYDTKTPETLPVNEQLPEMLREGFTKMKHGGRLLAIMANDLSSQAGQTEAAQPTKVFVMDVVGTPPKPLAAATGEKTGETLKGVKVEDAGEGKAPKLTTRTKDKPAKELVVKTLIKGEGDPVKAGQTLTVHYTGKLWGADKEFDSSWGRGEPAQFPLGQVIQGWQQGLEGVPVGSRVVMSIPPNLAYGDQEQQGIPANSTLVFVVDVLGAY
jgi:FKBP-type peptidyl-prolyl cis-trans isomerase